MSEVAVWSTMSLGENQTLRLGEILGENLGAGCVVALFGEMGSGKTRLVQGIARGLRVPSSNRVCSPSFALIHEYEGSVPLFHMDFFRLSSESLWADLGVDEYLLGEGICVIEWADRIDAWLPADRMEVWLTIHGPRKRGLAFRAYGDRHSRGLKAVMREYQCRRSKDKSTDAAGSIGVRGEEN
jgi:tRNA threonylcarbamoyladenosine biosynthesis protein TsaE